MFVGYADNHAGNVYRFVNLKTKKIILSRDITWMNILYGEIYEKNDVERRYNLKNNTSEDTFIEIETEGDGILGDQSGSILGGLHVSQS